MTWSSSLAASLRMYPRTPAWSASRAKAVSSCIVSTTILVSGDASLNDGIASSESCRWVAEIPSCATAAVVRPDHYVYGVATDGAGLLALVAGLKDRLQ